MGLQELNSVRRCLKNGVGSFFVGGMSEDFFFVSFLLCYKSNIGGQMIKTQAMPLTELLG